MGLDSTRGGRAIRKSVLIALGVACVATAPSLARAEDKKFLIGIVELQLANPFFGKLEKAAVDTAKQARARRDDGRGEDRRRLGHADRRRSRT